MKAIVAGLLLSICVLSSGCGLFFGVLGTEAAIASYKDPKFCHQNADCKNGKSCSLIAGHTEGACVAKSAAIPASVVSTK